MRLTVFLFVLFGAVSSASCQFQPAPLDEELKTIVNSDSVFLVDVRTVEEFDEGHIEGSVNIPVNLIEYNLDKFEGKKQIVVFCKGGKRAATAKDILEKNGFDNVTNGGTWINVERHILPKEEALDESQTCPKKRENRLIPFHFV